MAKNAMPKSKAKTAYGLLSEIRKLILEEPKRYDQTVWKRDAYFRHATDRPACGTICCVAGWVDTLKNPSPVSYRTANDGDVILSFASAALGLGPSQAEVLFAGDAAGENRRGFGEFDFVGHARRGAKHIAKFQKKYAKQLKAKRV